jgi:hypothetical protein
MQIDITNLNCDTLFILFTTLDNIEQYYVDVVPNESIVAEMRLHKQEINQHLANDDMRIVKENDEFVLDCI